MLKAFTAFALLSGAVSGSVMAQAAPPPVPAVPEPATWAMLIAGFALVGYVVRRRRSSRVHG